MSTAEIAEKIQEDAREQARLIETKATREVERAISSSEETAANTGDTVAAARDESRKNEGEQTLIKAELARRDKTIGAKRELLERAFATAKVHLERLEEDVYVELITDLIARHARGGQEIILDAKTADGVKDRIISSANEMLQQDNLRPVRLSGESRDLGPGFIITAGHIEEDRSFDTLLRSAAEELEADVAAMLFSTN